MRARFYFLVAAACLCGCGYVGDTKAPALNIPVKIEDLRALQRGASVIVMFTPSYKTTEALRLPELGGIELRCGPMPAGGWDWNRWLAGTRELPVGEIKEETLRVEVPSAEWQGKEIVLAVRAFSRKGRRADWSNLVAVSVVAPLPKPEQWSVANAPVGVKLTAPPNRPAGAGWRIWRQGPADAASKLLGVSGADSYTDATAAAGAKYIYIVQAVVPGGAAEAESEFSDPKEIVPADVFAPDPPRGLNVIAGVGSLELMWDRNAEGDLAAYVVYRADAGDFQRHGEAAAAPGFSDHAVEAGKKYRYRITARDRAGNESAPSNIVEILAP